MNIKQQVIREGLAEYNILPECPCGYKAIDGDDYCTDHKECFECEGDGCRLCDGEGWI